MEKARKILRRDDDCTQQLPSSSAGTVRRTRAPAIYRFSKDSLTGRRKTHCQYRERSSAVAKNKSLQSDVSVANDANVSGLKVLKEGVMLHTS